MQVKRDMLRHEVSIIVVQKSSQKGFLRGNSPKKGYREDKMIVCNCISVDLPAVITCLTPPPGLSPAFNDMTLRDKPVTLLNGGGNNI